MKLDSIDNWLKCAEAGGLRLSDIVLSVQAEELELPPDSLLHKTESAWQTMLDSIEHGLEPSLRSESGFVGGGAARIQAAGKNCTLCDCGVMNHAMVYAMAAAEYNACMGKICAAPTAGSCGILPGVLKSLADRYHPERERIIYALLTASGVGMVIAERANLSGAEGGCQAECGSASAMAAAAAVELMEGTPRMAANAASIALMSVMGLVCDPVAGLVECPCVKRNASGAANALAAANMALSGIESIIPPDEVIGAMKQVGDMMNPSLKETSLAGLAGTPTGMAIAQKQKETITCQAKKHLGLD